MSKLTIVRLVGFGIALMGVASGALHTPWLVALLPVGAIVYTVATIMEQGK